MSIETKLFTNRRFKDDDPADAAVLKDDKGAVLIRQEVDETSAIVWLSNKTALEIATWILDNVSEVGVE